MRQTEFFCARVKQNRAICFLFSRFALNLFFEISSNIHSLVDLVVLSEPNFCLKGKIIQKKQALLLSLSILNVWTQQFESAIWFGLVASEIKYLLENARIFSSPAWEALFAGLFQISGNNRHQTPSKQMDQSTPTNLQAYPLLNNTQISTAINAYLNRYCTIIVDVEVLILRCHDLPLNLNLVTLC